MEFKVTFPRFSIHRIKQPEAKKKERPQIRIIEGEDSSFSVWVEGKRTSLAEVDTVFDERSMTEIAWMLDWNGIPFMILECDEKGEALAEDSPKDSLANPWYDRLKRLELKSRCNPDMAAHYEAEIRRCRYSFAQEIDALLEGREREELSEEEKRNLERIEVALGDPGCRSYLLAFDARSSARAQIILSDVLLQADRFNQTAAVKDTASEGFFFNKNQQEEKQQEGTSFSVINDKIPDAKKTKSYLMAHPETQLGTLKRMDPCNTIQIQMALEEYLRIHDDLHYVGVKYCCQVMKQEREKAEIRYPLEHKRQMEQMTGIRSGSICGDNEEFVSIPRTEIGSFRFHEKEDLNEICHVLFLKRICFAVTADRNKEPVLLVRSRDAGKMAKALEDFKLEQEKKEARLSDVQTRRMHRPKRPVNSAKVAFSKEDPDEGKSTAQNKGRTVRKKGERKYG